MPTIKIVFIACPNRKMKIKFSEFYILKSRLSLTKNHEQHFDCRESVELRISTGRESDSLLGVCREKSY